VLAAAALVSLSIGGAAGAARRRHHPRASPPPPPAEIDPGQGCQSNPAVVGPCFELQGRSFRAHKGTPSLRIQPARSRRALGVLPSGAEIIPACLQDLVQPGVAVRGRFLVCPLTVATRRQMQMVCVQEVRQLVASRWDPATQQLIAMASESMCALEAPVK
jgi:hypothetical protein